MLFSYLITSFSLVSQVVAFSYPNFDKYAKLKCDKLTGDYSAFNLDNGLDVVIHVHDDQNLPVKASLSVGVGSSGVSKNEPALTQPISGLAHLVEHCLFYASTHFPDAEGFNNFFKSHGGYSNAATYTDQTFFEFALPHGRYIMEAFQRFAAMFISPQFTDESVKAQRNIVDREWSVREGLNFNFNERYPQMLITEGHPSKLFGCGNSETLGVNDILDQVVLFWKTHYTSDNMKLAISVHRGSKDLVEYIITDLFKRIPVSPKKDMPAPTYPDTFLPFWSPVHANQYMKIYPEISLRNELHFYWNIYCDKGAVCKDSLQFAQHSVKSALQTEFYGRELYVVHYLLSPNQYVFEIMFEVKKKEISNLVSLKNKLIDILFARVSYHTYFDENSVNYVVPPNLANSLAQAMQNVPIMEVPRRAHYPYFHSDDVMRLLHDHLLFLERTPPRIIASYMKEFKPADKALLTHRYNALEYEFADHLGIPISSEIKLSKRTESIIRVNINHSELAYPRLFLRQVIIEIILIRLKESNLYVEHLTCETYIQLNIFFETGLLEQTMKSIMEAFDSVALPSIEVFEKAKRRWVRKMKQETFNMSLPMLAPVYLRILASSERLDESSLLLSDPNPEELTIQEAASAGCILQKLSTISVTLILSPNESVNIDEANFSRKMRDMWEKGISNVDYKAYYAQPGKGETFIYAPPPIPNADSLVIMLFDLGDYFGKYLLLMTNILDRYIYMRLRTERQLAYGPVVELSGKRVYIMIPAQSTPEVIQHEITSAIEDIPDYIRKMSPFEWEKTVKGSIFTLEDDNFFITPDGKEDVIEKMNECFSDSGSRLIIQFWGRKHRIAREKYLGRMKLFAPSTTIIPSIKDFPTQEEIPTDLHAKVVA